VRSKCPIRPTIFDGDVPALGEPRFPQSLAKRDGRLRRHVGLIAVDDVPDHRHCRLRANGERPGSHRAAEKVDELPPPHSNPSFTITGTPYQMISYMASGACCIAIARSEVGHEETKTDATSTALPMSLVTARTAVLNLLPLKVGKSAVCQSAQDG
jgi:hypothetical protein